jgi:orotate phosphoribosyltransferase
MTSADALPMPEAFGALAVRQGHFVLESGLHAEHWIDLDALFVDPVRIAPQIGALSALVSAHDVTAVCGPLLGGALVAQAVATRLGVRFYFTERVPEQPDEGLFGAIYRLPDGLRDRAAHERFAVVDDVISAGSSVRATVADLASLGGRSIVVGALLVLGHRAPDYFEPLGMHVVAPSQSDFAMWPPADCPHCRAGVPLTDPARSGTSRA